MKSTGPVLLVLMLLTITWTSSMPTKESTTRRPQIGDTIKELTSQLMNANDTSSDLTLDTRTPPKVKQQLKKLSQKKQEATLENSHPGVAVPVEDADLVLEESTKSFNFYKIENKPTTDQGISTWVLLHSQTVPPSSTTTKATRKPPIKHKLDENKNLTAFDAEIFNKITRPLFKKRPLATTTKKPTSTTAKIVSTPDKEYKLTKIKASVLTNAMNTKNKTETNNVNKKADLTTTSTDNMLEVATINPNTKVSTPFSTNDNELIPPIEAKDDEIELLTTTTQSSKKTRRTTNKRKKNKKRRRPSIDKSDTNSTKLANKLKEKPISTQIYNYLSREIIPTVGVGLVGLVVTAGLASYFLYPFGPVRRSYDIDRKDKENFYYYKDEYAPGGMAEEEVIGKVIAGMPVNNQYQNYRSQMSRDAYSNSRYKQDFGLRKAQPQASVEAIYLTPSRQYGEEDAPHRSYKPEYFSPQRNYNKEVMEHSQETGYTVDDKQFVVGNVPKEMQQEVTPVVVPEHGPRHLPEAVTKKDASDSPDKFSEHEPRNLKIRKRRSNDIDNEIPKEDNDNRKKTPNEKKKEHFTSTQSTTSTTNSTTVASNKPQSFITSLRNLFEAKIRMGLELLQNTSRAISRYFSEVQRRFISSNKALNPKSKEQPRMH